MDLEKLWEEILKELKPQLSVGNFIGVLTPTALLSLEDNIATIAAPSITHINLLEKRFQTIIIEALKKHTKSEKDIDVLFIHKVIHKRKHAQNDDEGPLFSTNPQPVTHNIKPVGHVPRVRPDFTFETLAVSESNRLAYVSAQKISENIGQIYNPLFIYGPVGVGKTHLMQAIANEVYRKDPSVKIVYITSEEFTNEVVEAIRNNDTAKMKKKFRSANLLIIDDVQFIAGKEKVQEELFHTFNSLIDNRAQIVLSSDKPPSEIKKLESRLSSRFAGGLTVDVESPDFEMRTAILLKKSEQLGFPISIEIAKAIAEEQQDVRSLEGALMRAITQARTEKRELTPELAARAMNGIKEERRATIHSEDIIESTCTFYNIKTTQLKGPKRQASLVKARQVTMYLLNKELGLTLVDIGNLLGGRDHTTIMHGVGKVENLLKTNPNIHEEISGIMKNVRG